MGHLCFMLIFNDFFGFRVLRVLGLLLADGAPTVGRGKIGVVWQKSDFWTKNQNFGPKKEVPLFNSNHVLATTGKSCSKKKSAFAQIIKGGNVILGDFLG